MILPDVNTLIYAHREEMPRHVASRAWLEQVLASGQPFALATVVLSGFVRAVTNPRAFDPPSTMEQALAFTSVLTGDPSGVWLTPDRKHWALFEELCREPGIKGGLVTDAYIAATAIANGCELVTEDGDFKRFAPRLKVRAPAAESV